MIRILFTYGIPILSLILLIYALVDALKVPDDSMYQTGNKLIWVIVIIFAQPLIGPIIYLMIGAPQTPRQPRRMQRPPDDII
jgi:phospholipase D-like protein